MILQSVNFYYIKDSSDNASIVQIGLGILRIIHTFLQLWQTVAVTKKVSLTNNNK